MTTATIAADKKTRKMTLTGVWSKIGPARKTIVDLIDALADGEQVKSDDHELIAEVLELLSEANSKMLRARCRLADKIDD